MPTPTVRKVSQLTGHNAAIYALTPGPTPGTFLSGGGDGWIVQWSLEQLDEQGEMLGRLLAKVEAQVFSVIYIPTTETVVAGDMNGGVHWINLGEDRPNRHIAHHKKGTFGFYLLGEELISFGGDGVISRWDILRQSSSESLKLSSQSLRSLTYDAATDEFFVGSSDHNIYRLSAKDFSLRETIKGAHDNSVFALHTHPLEPSILFSAGRDAQLKKWTITGEAQLQEAQPAHWFTINHLIATSEGQYMLSASRDKTIRIWDSATFKLKMTLDAVRDGGHVNSVNRLLWLEGTKHFVSASDDRSLILWEME